MTASLYDVAEATWPAASARRVGPWMIRDGRGGGKRVSAATAQAEIRQGDIAQAEAAMTALGQALLFMIRDGDEALDALLAARGYEAIDPVVIYAAPVAALASEAPPPISAFILWEPLKIMRDIWAEGGIGAPRQAVMARVQGPKTAILGRSQDRAAGTGFIAVHGKTAMLHALEVTPTQRRQGTAVNMVRAAAQWAQDIGAESVAVLVTKANAPARALYTSLGMRDVGQYHYRMKCA